MSSVFERFPGFVQAGARLSLVFAGPLLLLGFFYSRLTLIRNETLGRIDFVCLVITLLGAATCFALKSQFSSRYFLASLSFLFYAVRGKMRPGQPISLLFAGFGALLGAAPLASYCQWI